MRWRVSDRALASSRRLHRRTRVSSRSLPLDWLGVAPFLVFALMFLILPTLYLIVGAFQNARGEFTLENIFRLSEPSIRSAYWISIRISLASAVLGASCRAEARTLAQLGLEGLGERPPAVLLRNGIA